MHYTAAERAGYFRSKTYLGSDKKHLWECSEGHRWEAAPEQVRHGSWCPLCGYEKSANARRFTIDDMHRLAAARGGKCLSKNYINTDFRAGLTVKFI